MATTHYIKAEPLIYCGYNIHFLLQGLVTNWCWPKATAENEVFCLYSGIKSNSDVVSLSLQPGPELWSSRWAFNFMFYMYFPSLWWTCMDKMESGSDCDPAFAWCDSWDPTILPMKTLSNNGTFHTLVCTSRCLARTASQWIRLNERDAPTNSTVRL